MDIQTREKLLFVIIVWLGIMAIHNNFKVEECTVYEIQRGTENIDYLVPKPNDE